MQKINFMTNKLIMVKKKYKNTETKPKLTDPVHVSLHITGCPLLIW